MKKTLTGLALAGLLVMGGASAATAANYPDDAPVITTPNTTPGIGEAVTLTVRVPEGIPQVTFSITGAPAGSTLASVATAVSRVNLAVDKPVVSRIATAVFTPAGHGTHTIVVTAPGMDPISLSVVVADPNATGPGAGNAGAGNDLAATGGGVPAGIIWAGVGALGLGGIVVASTAARRRSVSNN